VIHLRSRHRLLALVALVGVSTVVGAVLLRPSGGSPPPVRTSGERLDVFGFAVGGGLQDEQPETVERDVDAVVAAHARWIRLDVNWARVQAGGPESYDWAPFDRVVRAARDRGLHVLAVLVYTPEWARPPGSDATHAPDPVRYAAFAAAAARRYSRMGVHAYEIWNEPNVVTFWKPRPDPVAYAALLRAAHPAIAAADPRATVVTGGTAPAESDGVDVGPVDFLAGLYAAGARGNFDAVGHHPYTAPLGPGDAAPWSAWHQMDGTSPSLRSTMERHGDGAKRIWATEFGAPTGGADESAVSEQRQAAMVTRAYALFRRYSWSGPLFWYAARDSGASMADREASYGLLRNDFTPKPGFRAYQAAAARP
jgi:hypothetical protein